MNGSNPNELRNREPGAPEAASAEGAGGAGQAPASHGGRRRGSPQASAWSFWLGIAVLLVILACVGVATFLTGGAGASRPNVAKIGARAPEIKLRLLEAGRPGRPVTLTELEGKPVVLNFWATWCNPCRQEFPALQAHYEKHKDEGLVLVGIDSQGDVGPAGAASFIKQMSTSFPIWLDEDGSAEESYRVDSLPTTFFIDRQGIIQDVVVGGPMTVDYLEKELKKIL